MFKFWMVNKQKMHLNSNLYERIDEKKFYQENKRGDMISFY